MADKRKLGFISALALAAAALSGAAASAATCPTAESFFGTIQRVNGNMLTVRTPSNHWADVQINTGAQLHTNGNTLRVGTYIGAYGCVTPNGVFRASELTLAGSPNGYNERISGVVRGVQNGKLIVAEGNREYGAWYVPDTDEFHVGQSVSALGMRAGNGSFYPQTINGRSVAYDTDATAPASSRTISLTGTVQRVESNRLVVWEQSRHQSGTWVLSNAGRFRIGQRVSATGTEDRRGNFYVQQITIL